MENEIYDDYDENYWSRYGEYAGSSAQDVVVHSDNVTNDAFG